VKTCIVLLICLLSTQGQPYRESKAIATYTCQYTNKYKVDPIVVLAIMKHESSFRQLKYPSRTNDYGLMQLHCPKDSPFKFCNRCNVKKMECNIKEGVRLLYQMKKSCLAKNKGTHHWLRHYNWYDRQYPNKILKIINELERARDACTSNYPGIRSTGPRLP